MLHRPGDGVIAAGRLELEPVDQSPDQRCFLVERQVVEHGDVEVALAPDELGAAGLAQRQVFVEPCAGLVGEVVDTDVGVDAGVGH